MKYVIAILISVTIITTSHYVYDVKFTNLEVFLIGYVVMDIVGTFLQ